VEEIHECIQEGAARSLHHRFYFRSRKSEIDSWEFLPDANPAEFRREKEKSKARLICHLHFLGLSGSLEISLDFRESVRKE
ncbi:Hypothetical predicted protein, partial [Marmota monax]